jgi:hypothetical protein
VQTDTFSSRVGDHYFYFVCASLPPSFPAQMY